MCCALIIYYNNTINAMSSSFVYAKGLYYCHLHFSQPGMKHFYSPTNKYPTIHNYLTLTPTPSWAFLVYSYCSRFSIIARPYPGPEVNIITIYSSPMKGTLKTNYLRCKKKLCSTRIHLHIVMDTIYAHCNGHYTCTL